MKRVLVVLTVLLLCGLVFAPATQAATSGTATVTLAASATAKIEILDNAITLTPTDPVYDSDYVEAAGASGSRPTPRRV